MLKRSRTLRCSTVRPSEPVWTSAVTLATPELDVGCTSSQPPPPLATNMANPNIVLPISFNIFKAPFLFVDVGLELPGQWLRCALWQRTQITKGVIPL